MKKLNVALLAGGNSSEREIALASTHMVYEAFDKAKYNVFLVDVHGRHWTCEGAGGRQVEVDKTDFSIPVGGGKIVFDYAFVMIHGTPGEDGKLQGYLEMMGIPYSTSDTMSSVTTFDKALCKRVVSGANGINLAREVLLRRGDEVKPSEIVAKLGLPVFVKPNASGSSCGVTKVKTENEISAAVEKAFTESDAVLIEEFIAGREFGCGVIITAHGVQALPVTEIIPHKEFFDYEAKYTDGMTRHLLPAPIDETTAAICKDYAVKIHKALGCNTVSRSDFRYNPTDGVVFLEINTNPGLTPLSLVPEQANFAGISYRDVCVKLVEGAKCRFVPSL